MYQRFNLWYYSGKCNCHSRFSINIEYFPVLRYTEQCQIITVGQNKQRTEPGTRACFCSYSLAMGQESFLIAKPHCQHFPFSHSVPCASASGRPIAHTSRHAPAPTSLVDLSVSKDMYEHNLMGGLWIRVHHQKCFETSHPQQCETSCTDAYICFAVN